MIELERLIKKALERDARLSIRLDPEEEEEQWEVKLYPESDDDAHFYAYNNDLQAACRQLLDELKESKW